MKSIILGCLIFISSVSVWACPDLSGKYKCTFIKNEPFSIHFKQEVDESGVVSYYEGNMEKPFAIADNVERPVKDQENGLRNGKEKSFCEGQKLVSHLNGDIVYDEEKHGEMFVNNTYYIGNKTGFLFMVTSGWATQDGKKGYFNTKESCHPVK